MKNILVWGIGIILFILGAIIGPIGWYGGY